MSGGDFKIKSLTGYAAKFRYTKLKKRKQTKTSKTFFFISLAEMFAFLAKTQTE